MYRSDSNKNRIQNDNENGSESVTTWVASLATTETGTRNAAPESAETWLSDVQAR